MDMDNTFRGLTIPGAGLLGSNRVLNMKLDFPPPVATFLIVFRRISPRQTEHPARMALSFSDIVEEARLSARALLDYGDHFFNPTVRLRVTGLSRARKTLVITAPGFRLTP